VACPVLIGAHSPARESPAGVGGDVHVDDVDADGPADVPASGAGANSFHSAANSVVGRWTDRLVRMGAADVFSGVQRVDDGSGPSVSSKNSG